MSDTVIWIIVAAIAVLVLLAALAFALRTNRRKDVENRRAQAEQLRQEATATAPDQTEARLRAQEADAQAELARREAERAQQAAAEEQRRVAAEEAHRENLVREADRIDPDVDHRAEGDRPGAGNPPKQGPPGSHRA
jgi:biopolymer transport protein ExbB/TolQ